LVFVKETWTAVIIVDVWRTRKTKTLGIRSGCRR